MTTLQLMELSREVVETLGGGPYERKLVNGRHAFESYPQSLLPFSPPCFLSTRGQHPLRYDCGEL